MLSPPLVVIGDPNGSLVPPTASSPGFRLREATVGIPDEEEDEWDRIIALAGSFSRPDGEAVYGDAEEGKGALGPMATLSLGGMEADALSSESKERVSILLDEADWTPKGDGRCRRSEICWREGRRVIRGLPDQ